MQAKKFEFEEIKEALTASGNAQKKLFEIAQKIRNESCGKKAFIRAVIEPSSYCRLDCSYCPMRASNKILERYRLAEKEILNAAEDANKKGIKNILIESGEDIAVLKDIASAVAKIKEKGNTITLCMGDLTEQQYQMLKEAGAEAYILKFETSNEELFSQLRLNTSLKKRLENLRRLKEIGFKVSTGNIAGLPGQTIDDLAKDILLVQEIKPDMVSASPFIPAKSTPLEKSAKGNINLTLNTIALYRQILPSALIPTVSALEYFPGHGQRSGFEAGANVITVNFTPSSKNFAIYSTERLRIKLDRAYKTIKESGLTY